MKKVFILLLACLTVFPAGCTQKEETAVTGICFERGHGSAWGNQFSIRVDARQIITASYIPQGSSEPVTVEQLPITETQWQELTDLLAQLSLKKARRNFWDFHKLDGGEFRKLTLTYGSKEISYQWPSGEQAAAWEALLESLVTKQVR